MVLQYVTAGRYLSNPRYYFEVNDQCVIDKLKVTLFPFLHRILKRILIAEVTSSEKHSSKRHYLLLFVSIAQLPLLCWLGNVGV
ncbi:hypothetical protein DKX38_010085 [Salix brachista]|uniref:Uncharacterized protein n=1 Tax=Salix brachista TaxID=2182728 RepID=A0A5N5MC47_9ROSI|nr:hypothetical protein DKX38_010085 [Salix brachista]